jgi:hypothetical protein
LAADLQTNGLLALGAGLIGYSLNSERGTQLKNYVVQYVAPYVAPLAANTNTTSATNTTSDDNILHYDCRAGEYTIELLNLDPPIVYINNFLSEDEIVDLVRLGYVVIQLLSPPGGYLHVPSMATITNLLPPLAMASGKTPP